MKLSQKSIAFLLSNRKTDQQENKKQNTNPPNLNKKVVPGVRSNALAFITKQRHDPVYRPESSASTRPAETVAAKPTIFKTKTSKTTSFSFPNKENNKQRRPTISKLPFNELLKVTQQNNNFSLLLEQFQKSEFSNNTHKKQKSSLKKYGLIASAHGWDPSKAWDETGIRTTAAYFLASSSFTKSTISYFSDLKAIHRARRPMTFAEERVYSSCAHILGIHKPKADQERPITLSHWKKCDFFWSTDMSLTESLQKNYEVTKTIPTKKRNFTLLNNSPRATKKKRLSNQSPIKATTRQTTTSPLKISGATTRTKQQANKKNAKVKTTKNKLKVENLEGEEEENDNKPKRQSFGSISLRDFERKQGTITGLKPTAWKKWCQVNIKDPSKKKNKNKDTDEDICKNLFSLHTKLNTSLEKSFAKQQQPQQTTIDISTSEEEEETNEIEEERAEEIQRKNLLLGGLGGIGGPAVSSTDFSCTTTNSKNVFPTTKENTVTVNASTYTDFLSTCWFLFSRPDENKYTNKKTITTNNPANDYVIFDISSAKVDQREEGWSCHLGCACYQTSKIMERTLCPVHSISDECFHAHAALPAKIISNLTNAWLDTIGLDNEKSPEKFGRRPYGPYSIRIGGAMCAASGGLHPDTLLKIGRWKHSKTESGYIGHAILVPVDIYSITWPIRKTINLLNDVELENPNKKPIGNPIEKNKITNTSILSDSSSNDDL